MKEFNDEYDTALICLEGHVVNPYALTVPADNSKHCRKCGVAAISECPTCKGPIRGGTPGAMSVVVEGGPPRVMGFRFPAYCEQCGAAFPWTERRIAALAEFIDLADGLSPDERDALVKSIPEIVAETSRTESAVVRFRLAAKKIAGEAAKGFVRLLGEVATETVRRRLFDS